MWWCHLISSAYDNFYFDVFSLPFIRLTFGFIHWVVCKMCLASAGTLSGSAGDPPRLGQKIICVNTQQAEPSRTLWASPARKVGVRLWTQTSLDVLVIQNNCGIYFHRQNSTSAGKLNTESQKTFLFLGIQLWRKAFHHNRTQIVSITFLISILYFDKEG